MDQLFLSLAETFLPWVEDRFGSKAAVIAAAAVIMMPIVMIVGVIVWVNGGA